MKIRYEPGQVRFWIWIETTKDLNEDQDGLGPKLDSTWTKRTRRGKKQG
jgi:hypothetical protein